MLRYSVQNMQIESTILTANKPPLLLCHPAPDAGSSLEILANKCCITDLVRHDISLSCHQSKLQLHHLWYSKTALQIVRLKRISQYFWMLAAIIRAHINIRSLEKHNMSPRSANRPAQGHGSPRLPSCACKSQVVRNLQNVRIKLNSILNRMTPL